MAKSMKRRCKTHDYRSRCIYMITVNKLPGIPAFSDVYGNPLAGSDACHVKYFNLGALIADQLRKLPPLFHDSRLLQYIIMPDHIHFVLFIEKHVDYHLGEIVKKLSGICTAANNLTPIFEEGYHDRICWRRGQLERMIKYVRDNPRRLLMKRLHPEYFRSHHSVYINGKVYDSFGNPDLLNHPVKAAVRISSKYSLDRLAAFHRLWDEVIREEGVLISPFISRDERKIRDKAISEGADLIYFTKERFGERYKPQGYLFEMCSEGRLLLISLGDEGDGGSSITRREALRMNELAEILAST